MKDNVHECHIDRLRSYESTLHMELLGLTQDLNEAQKFSVHRLDERFRKKLPLGNSDLDKVAISNFLGMNQVVKGVNPSLSEDIINNARHFIVTSLENYTTAEVRSIQCSLDLKLLFSHWRFGPGSSNGVKGTHFVEKIVQPMTSTARAAPFVRLLRRLDPYLYQYDLVNGLGVQLVEGNRITTVPKNQDTARTIAIEPSGNMALQLAAGCYLEGALTRVGLNIRTQQDKNQMLAYIGSVDGSIATIDMKSCSDLISKQLCELLLPPEWFSLLSTIRSEQCELPGGTSRTLHMMSTMGNGFTFPLMTLLFVALIYAQNCMNGGPNLSVNWKTYAVYGDDLIVPSAQYTELCSLLEAAGFIINLDKSYSDGPFRESCGGDYYKGHNVTPFYVASLERDSDVYVAINQLVKWCVSQRVFLPITFGYLRSLLERKDPFLVPEWFQPYSGIQTAQVSRRFKYLHLVKNDNVVPNHPLRMIMVLGKYIKNRDGTDVFTPRALRTRFKVRSSKLPNGWLDGSDAKFRTTFESCLGMHFISACLDN